MKDLQIVLDALSACTPQTDYMRNAKQEAIAIVKQMMRADPVAYEIRMRAEWVADWGRWTPCSKEHHEMYIRAPKLHDWIYETRALFAAPQAVPEGFVLVPVEPTPEMCKAARAVPDACPPYPPHFHLIWDAMLAAAPKGVA